MSRRIRARSIVVLLGACAVAFCAGLVAPSDATSAETKAVIHKDVAEAMTEAKKLADKKQWNAALAALRRAEQAPDKTPYAEYKIGEFTGYVLTQQRMYPEAAAAFERITASEQAPADERAAHLKTAAQLYLQAKQYGDAGRVAAAALKSSPDDTALIEMAGQARYLAGDFVSAVDAMKELVDLTQKQGRKPEEGWLQILLNSYYKLNDREGIADTWQALLRHYPQPKYWENVLRLRTATSLPEPVELGYLRLTFDLGLLRDPQDYEDLALSAIDAGAPAEAVRVIEWGFEHGIFPAAEQARFKRMLAQARNEVAQDEARLEQLAQDAKRATTGELSVALGRAYLSRGRYDDAAAALRLGLEKGQLSHPDQARIDLGIAYLKNRQHDAAREAFVAIDTRSDWHDLAQLWALRASEASGR